MEMRWPGAYGPAKKRRRSDGGATPCSKSFAVVVGSTGIVHAAPGGDAISRRPRPPWPEALSPGVSRGHFDHADHEVDAMAIAPLTDITHVFCIASNPRLAHAALPPGVCRGRFDLVADALAPFTDISHVFYVAWEPRPTHAAPRGANHTTLLCNVPNCSKRFQLLVLDPFEPFGRIHLTLQRDSETRPGSPVAWEGFSDPSEAELVCDHALWAVVQEAFNCSNADIYRRLAIGRKCTASFFAAYDALCEEWTATPVQKGLDEIADVSVPGDSDLGPSLRQICAANRSDEKKQMKAFLETVGSSMCPGHCDWFGKSCFEAQSRSADISVVTLFLQAHLMDYATKKLQAPETLSAAAARKSVCDLLLMVATTDSPDWCSVEIYGNLVKNCFTKSHLADTLTQFYQKPQALHTCKVKMPSHFLLGAIDLWVPVSNRLQGFKGPTTVLNIAAILLWLCCVGAEIIRSWYGYAQMGSILFRAIDVTRSICFILPAERAGMWASMRTTMKGRWRLVAVALRRTIATVKRKLRPRGAL